MALTQAVTILMIEDDDGHARLIEKNIRRAGLSNEILHLRNGTAAVEFLFGPDGAPRAHHTPFMILLDLNLPDMSGVDILSRVKADERFRRAPVIVLTTTDDKAEIDRCYDLGCNVYITKPLIYQSFAEAIRQLGLFLSVIQLPEQAPT
ncbi:response regulator [Lichenibacterium dinghuense]|uniref:response regulator n=1 Tax=Lichenibacterium dinghuense TaxID=2895977 RepID=UPI00272ECE84|nr:response regulator [Lichenibacterium sp. 6Y81]